jgi:hypothetical protein
MIEAAVTRARNERKNWRPGSAAWDQLLEVQQFIGRHVRIQFWNPVMYLLNEHEWPHPVVAKCSGVITMNEGADAKRFCDANLSGADKGRAKRLFYKIVADGRNPVIPPSPA